MAAKKQIDNEVSNKSKLLASFQSRLSKSKDKSVLGDAEFDVMYSTGFLSLDYLNGTMVHVKSDTINTSYRAIGLVDGSANTIISRPGCGKSTLSTQIIGNILRKFPMANAYIDDIEGSLPAIRKEFLLGLSQEELKARVSIRDRGITTENVYNRIRAIRDIKIENKEEYTYDTGLYDTFGNRIYKFYPTLYFIDSFAMLMPNDINEDDELDGGMGATATAKKNTQLVKKISQLLKEANIILITINHILDDIQMGFLPKPVQVSGLKQGERLPGGKAAIYLANNMFRMDEKSTLKESEAYGINGTVVDIGIVKSRTNVNKRSVPLIFNKSVGAFDNTLSLFHLLKTEGRVGGAGSYLYLENLPDVKFSQKNFKNVLNENTELQQAFVALCKEVLDGFLSNTINQEMDTSKVFDINANMSIFD